MGIDRNEAWEIFCKTGKVSDYIAYCGLKQQPEPPGAPAWGDETSGVGDGQRDRNQTAEY